MKHLFLVLLSLAFSVCVFSQTVPVPVPDNPVAVVYDQPAAVSDYSTPEIEVVGFELSSPDIFQHLKTVSMTYANNFGQALEALNAGEMVKRQSFGENVFIFKQVPSTIDKLLVPRMTSLPQSVKDEFERRRNDKQSQLNGDIYYTDQFAIVDNSNVIRGYSPSVEDAFATDWVILG